MAFITGSVIPDKILRLMSKADREKFGKAGQMAEETLAKAAIKNEGDLQKQIISWLRMKGIEPIYQRMDKRTRTRVGTPDLFFAVLVPIFGHVIPTRTIACAWECKFNDGESSDEQKEMAELLTREPNGWEHKVIRSLDEAIAALRAVNFSN